MKKKQLRKFIALFDRLPEAAGILSGRYDNDQTEKDDLSSTVSEAYQAIRDIVEDPELKFLTKVFDEIDDNLYDYNSCCDKYIKDLLSGFAWIAPFLEFSPKMEWMNLDDESCPEDEQNCFPLYIATLSLISQAENLAGHEDELTGAEKYILACSNLLQNFAESLDARCLRFDLDFPAIQDELNIYIQTNRDLEKLALSGYMDKVKMLVSKEKAQMALSGVQSRPLSLMQKNPSAELDITDQNNLTLESVFADPYQYNCIMQILVEKKFCQPGTFIWIDLKKGYKTFIANLLKYLHFQNYYQNRAGLSNLQIQQIALNTFHVDIALDTIKHAEIRNSKFKFIPEASTIKENYLKIASRK